MKARGLTPRQAVIALVFGALVAGLIHARGVADRTGALPSADALRASLQARGHPATLGQHVPWLLLRDADDRPVAHALANDGRPTVIWFWSCLCRCVSDCEARIVALLERFPAQQLHFFAVDSNPDDSAHDIHQRRMSMGSPYEVFRDVNGATARHLGVDASASVAILDGAGRLRYRGAIDDDLDAPTESYVTAAVEAILAGRPLERTSAPSYGCRYPIPPVGSGS